MDRRTLTGIGLAALGLLLAFLLGYLPQRAKARDARETLARTEVELRLARLEGRLGAALTESLRGNYERSRQLVVDVFTELPRAIPQVEDPRRRAALQAVQAQQFELVTLLSRGTPESTQRLMLLHTAFHAAVDPAAARGASAVTPPPPAETAAADTARR